jgi:photosystem II stability/assembly factor-like uncharacterized protein
VPRYKDLATTSLSDVRAFSDTVFTVGARKIGSVTHYGLFRSLDAGATFDLTNESPALLYRSSMRRAPGGNVVGVMGGLADRSYVFRYDAQAGTLTQSTGIPGGNYFPTGVDISPATTQNAVVTFRGFPFTAQDQTGLAVRSTDGGRTFTNVALPTGTYNLQGTGFINDNEAFLLGDSSVVMRLNVTTGAVTKLGEANGIPQSVHNGPGDFTVYSFSIASFVPGSQVGFIAGSFTRRRPNQPDLVDGVLLVSRDGGQTFVRQGISGAPDNGLAFPLIFDMQAFAEDFAVISGQNGLLAARTSNEQSTIAVCSLNQQP